MTVVISSALACGSSCTQSFEDDCVKCLGQLSGYKHDQGRQECGGVGGKENYCRANLRVFSFKADFKNFIKHKIS